MAVAYFSQWPQADPETAQRVAERVNQQLGGQPPEGGIYHAEGPTDDGGWWTFNVWTSEDAHDTFARQILDPALREADAPPSQVRLLRVNWESSLVQGGD